MKSVFAIVCLVFFTHLFSWAQCLEESDSLYRSAEELYTNGEMSVAGSVFMQSALIEQTCKGNSFDNITGALSNAAVCFESANEYDNAEIAYHALLPFTKKLKDSATTASVFLSLSRIEMSRARFDHAASYADSSLRLYTSLRHLAGQTEALGLISDQLVFHGRYDEAIALLRPYVNKKNTSTTDIYPLLTQKIAAVYKSANVPDSALLYYVNALSYSQKIHDVATATENAALLASCYLRLGKLPQALEYYRLAADGQNSQDNSIGQAFILIKCAEILTQLDNQKQALGDLTFALQLYSQESYQEGVSAALLAFGGVYQSLHELDSAFYYYDYARQTAIYAGDSFLANKIAGLLADMYMQAGDLASAVQVYTQILVETPPNLSAEKAFLLHSLGRLYRQFGQDRDAEAVLKESLLQALSSGDYLLIGQSYMSLGDLKIDAGKTADALQAYRYSLEAYSRIRSVSNVIQSRIKIAEAHSLSGEQLHAISEYRTAFDMSMHVYDKHSAGIASLGISDIYNKQKIHDSVLVYLHRAASLFTQAGLKIELAECQNKLAVQYIDVKNYTRALFYLHQNIGLIQNAKIDNLASSLQIHALLGDSYRCLSDLYFAQDSSNKAFLYREMALAEDAAAALGSSDLLNHSLSLESLQSSISPSTAYLIYAQSQNADLYCLFLSNNLSEIVPLDVKVFAQKILTNDMLSKLSEAGSLQLGLVADWEYLRSHTAILTKVEAEIVFNGLIAGYSQALRSEVTDSSCIIDAGKLISSFLINPLYPKLANKTILKIMTSGMLYYLPFESLPQAEYSYLSRRFAISYVQSLTISSYSKNKKNAQTCSGGLVAWRPAHQMQDLTCTDNITKTEIRQLRLALSHVRDYSHMGALYSPAICFKNAPNKISDAIISDSVGTARLQDITEYSLKSMSDAGRLADYCYLHFNANAFSILDIPELSAVQLTPEKGEDGFITSREIAKLRINPHLVSINGYQSSVRLHSGNSVDLALPFIVAGAKSVLVSQWETSADFSKTFMSIFYSQMQDGAVTPADAIFRTKQEFIAGTHGFRWSKPYFWASFVLQE